MIDQPANANGTGGPARPERHRYRIRFAKQGDLRLTGHRDLIRLFERMFRRAELRLGMSEGFHPKPRMTFPAALALGVCGLDEVMELELAAPQSAESLKATLSRHAPPGLEIHHVEKMDEATKKAQVHSVWYEMPLPAANRDQVAERAREFLEAKAWHIERTGRERPIDVRPYIEEIHLSEDLLRVKVRVTREGTIRPRELVELLVESDRDDLGFSLARTAVELEP